MAAIELERILEVVEAFAHGFVAAILHPARRLQEDGGAEVAMTVPPVARARGRAAEAEDASYNFV